MIDTKNGGCYPAKHSLEHGNNAVRSEQSVNVLFTVVTETNDARNYSTLADKTHAENLKVAYWLHAGRLLLEDCEVRV